MRKINWKDWDAIIKSEKYSSGQISDMTAKVGERIQATTIRGRGRVLGCGFGKKGQVPPAYLRERICVEEGCRKPFQPGHHRKIRCSEECEKKARNRRSRERARRLKGIQKAKPAFHAPDGVNREGRNWKRYVEKNPYYLKMVYPKSTLAEAMHDMSARGAI